MEFKQSRGKSRAEAAREWWTSFQRASKYSIDGASWTLSSPPSFSVWRHAQKGTRTSLKGRRSFISAPIKTDRFSIDTGAHDNGAGHQNVREKDRERERENRRMTQVHFLRNSHLRGDANTKSIARFTWRIGDRWTTDTYTHTHTHTHADSEERKKRRARHGFFGHLVNVILLIQSERNTCP